MVKYVDFYLIIEYPMGKIVLTDDEIWNLLVEGWHFYKKTIRDKYVYLIRRRKQESKTIAKFDGNKELWIRLEGLQNKFKDTKKNTSNEDHISSIEKMRSNLLEQLAYDRGITKQNSCLYNHDNMCTLWEYNQEPPYFSDLSTLNKNSDNPGRIIDRGGNTVWRVASSPIYCAGCSMFKQRKGLDQKEYLNINTAIPVKVRLVKAEN